MSPAWPGWQAALVMPASSPPGARTRWHAANITLGPAAAAPGRPAPGAQPGAPQAVTTARAACPAAPPDPATRAAASAGRGRARRPAPAAAAANPPATGAGLTTTAPGLGHAGVTAAAEAA